MGEAGYASAKHAILVAGNDVGDLKVAISANQSASEEAVRRRAEAGLAARRASYLSQLKHKYERAAAHPWIHVEPDPTLPE
jgi:hypothetical protein